MVMIFFKKIKHIFYFSIIISFFLVNCTFKEPYKNHGINFLDNKFKILNINETNKNDAVKIIGRPHSFSINNENIWYYFERQTTRGDFHKLGKNVLVKNNVLKLEFDKYGVLINKLMIDKEEMNNIKMSKNKTKNDLGKRSVVGDFLQSLKQKMYKN